MIGRLAPVPEETTNGATAAACPPRSMYRDWIRTVAVSRAQIRSTLFSNSHPGQSGSSYSGDSGASDSYPSNSSGRSSGSASAAAPDFGAYELTMIARQMVSDGYTKRVVEAFSATSPAPALENWLSELDVDWILQIGNEHGSWWQLQLQDKSALSLQYLVERWIRALTVIAGSITELIFARHETSKVARFGRLSIAKMLVFVDAIVPALKAENLRAMLDMYICASNVAYMFSPLDMSTEAQIIFTETASSLGTARNKLNNAILSAMMEVRTFMEDDDSWATEIPRGGGDVHRNTRFMVDCIVSVRKARALTKNSAPSDNLGDLIHDTFDYLRDLLMKKSEFCSVPSLKYIFLLNNSNFVANMFEQSVPLDLELQSLHHRLRRQCEKYMDSYLDVSWGNVTSCIPKSVFSHSHKKKKSVFSQPLIHRWSNTSLLVNFESEFHQTYKVQKFWKVPEPRLRCLLRKNIAERVISCYRYWLKDNPELEKHVNRGTSSSPDILQALLGELFEG